MLGALLGVWIAGRAIVWESPFPTERLRFPVAELQMVEDALDHGLRSLIEPEAGAPPKEALPDSVPLLAGATLRSLMGEAQANGSFSMGASPGLAASQHLLLAAAFRVDWTKSDAQDMSVMSSGQTRSQGGVWPAVPPVSEGRMDRWSLDAFAYYRAGSNSAPITQTRAPVYGASQIAANLQYRVSPGSPQDPRAYLRAYRALVADGETELAAGFSARPVGQVPLRLAAELRVTENGFGTEARPAASVTSEVPPVGLPLDFTLEAYGSAGYVGGKADTYFAEGQVAVTREVARLEDGANPPARLSVGAASWAGAQRDTQRVDMGPTVRLDLAVGEVPARISLDWREQVAGDAAPGSGVAATLSTRF